MRQITATGRLPRLVSSAAAVFAFLFSLDHPLPAQMFVSMYSGGTLNKYDDTGLPHTVPKFNKALSIGGGGTEGASCLTTAGVPSLFVASNNAIITIVDPVTLTVKGSSVTIPGGSTVAGMSLDPSGSVLYAADYGTQKIWALNPAAILANTLSASPYVPTTASHDVAVDAFGNPYSADFQNANQGVFEWTPGQFSLTPGTPSPTQFVSAVNPPASIGLNRAGGLLYASDGTLWVSNFLRDSTATCSKLSDACDSVFQFSASGVLLHKILAPQGSGPLGLAQGPDGNIYVAMFNGIPSGTAPPYDKFVQSGTYVGYIGQIILPLPSAPTVIPIGLSPFNAAFLDVTGQNTSNPKYVSFQENCSMTPSPYVEVCKASSTTNPVPATGIYNFTVSGSAFSTSANPVMVPVGECSGPIPFTPSAPGNTVTITELPTPGVAVLPPVTAVAYTGPPTSQQEPLNVETNGNSATVFGVVTPAMPGDTSIETLVTFTNYESPPGELKLCKIAGDSATLNKSFTFTVTSSAGIVTQMVEAGPLAEGGYCVPLAGTFQVGTSVTFMETQMSPYSVSNITVNGGPGAPCTPANSYCVSAVIGPGVNEVSFTNTCSGSACQTATGGGTPPGIPHLKIVNYSLVSQQATAGTRAYLTYRADLLNGDTKLGPIVAKVTSLDPSHVQVVGRGVLNFAPMPANGQATSDNTFTIMTDAAVPLNFSMLSWTFESARSVTPKR